MSKDFAFLFKQGDYLRDTQCLSEKTQVAYDRIMCEHMRNICITKTQLNFFTKRLSPDEKDELFLILKQINGGFEIEWVAESIKERMAYSDSRRQNREGKTKKHMNIISKTYVKHMEGESEDEDNSLIKYKNEFDIFRKEYPGTKKGLDYEFENFTKKHKDWKDILPLLIDRLNYQKEARHVRKENKLFIPEWKHLQTWINQRCWEDQINTTE